MNRNILIAILLLSMDAGLTATAQEANAGPALDWSSFQSIAQKNIFDPSRSGRRPTRPARPRQRVAGVRTFTFNGAIDDTAWFSGEGTPAKGYLMVGDSINGYKVMQITLHYVKLAEPGGNIVVLKTDDSMRRDEDGPWYKSDESAPLVIVIPAASTPPDDSTTPSIDASAPSSDATAASAAPVNESDILAKLRLKREQEK